MALYKEYPERACENLGVSSNPDKKNKEKEEEYPSYDMDIIPDMEEMEKTKNAFNEYF